MSRNEGERPAESTEEDDDEEDWEISVGTVKIVSANSCLTIYTIVHEFWIPYVSFDDFFLLLLLLNY